MKQGCEMWEARVVDYLTGGLPPVENDAVQEHIESCPACRSVVGMWHRMGAWDVEMPSRPLTLRLPPAHREWRRWVAVAAALLIGIAGYSVGRGTAAREPAETAELRTELRALRETVALALLDRQSASDRLRGVQYSTRLERPDAAVLVALENTLRTDGSVDVRLAAADALRGFPQGEALQSKVLELLEREDAPLVKISLIDLLLESKSPVVRRRLEAMRDQPGGDPTVKRYLQQAITGQRWQ